MRINYKPIYLLLLFGISLTTLAQRSFRNASGSEADNQDNTQSQNQDEPDKETNTVPSRIKSWRVDDFLGKRIVSPVDTVPLNFQNQTIPERNQTLASEGLGNIGSPFLSKIYMDRTEKNAFLFMRPFDNWLTAPDEQVFLNTTTPYTNLKYLTTFGNLVSQEEDFKVLFSVNVNKYLNVGIDYEILSSRGFYTNNASRGKLANFFGNYVSPRYEAYWKLTGNSMDNLENGGITDDRYITNPLQMSGGLQQYESINIPVNLSDAKSSVKNRQLFFNHKYHLGFERTRFQKRDSLTHAGDVLANQRQGTPIPSDTITEFVPVTSLIHTLYIDQSRKSYRSATANPVFYDKVANIDNSYTADSSAMLEVRNTLGLSLCEGFHQWAKFGLTGFLEQDFRRYTSYSPAAALLDTTNAFSRLASYDKNLLWAGGELSKRQGSVLTYDALVKICVLGEDLGDFEAKGNLKTDFKLWNHPVSLSANGSIKNLHPDYFLEHYFSNHFSWNNTFSNVKKTRIGGTLDIPALGFVASAGVENLTDYVFFNNKALPEQFAGNIQIVSLDWKQHLGVGILNLDNELCYQLSSNQTVLPLPDLSVYSNLYLKFLISKVLTTQLGIDCRLHTDYYAPAYMPATGQFYTQQDVKVGNYPLMNLYGNFHLKRMRFFAMYSHLSSLFASPKYFSAPHYPINPAIFKVGLSWNFYD